MDTTSRLVKWKARFKNRRDVDEGNGTRTWLGARPGVREVLKLLVAERVSELAECIVLPDTAGDWFAPAPNSSIRTLNFQHISCVHL